MANFGKLVLTDDGYRVQALAEGGTPIIAKRMAMGSGTYTGNYKSLKALVKEEVSIQINDASLADDKKSFKFNGYFENKDLQIGFEWRELGLFVQDPDNAEKELLFCYSNAGNSFDFIPPATDERYDKYLTIQIGFENAESITINVPDSPLLVSLEDFKAHVEEFNLFKQTTDKAIEDHTSNIANPHKVTKAQVGLGNVDNTSDKDKPISDAMHTALDDKLSKTSGGVVTGETRFDGFAKLNDGLLRSSNNVHFGYDGLQVFNHSVLATEGTVPAVPVANRWYHILRLNHENDQGYYTEIALPVDGIGPDETISMFYRVISMGEEVVPWRRVIDDYNAGTYASAKDAGFLRPTLIEENTDLNNIIAKPNDKCGFYYCPFNSTAQTLSNCPTQNAFSLLVTEHAGTYQELVEHVPTNPKKWFRNYYFDGWGQWYRIYTEADNPMALDIEELEETVQSLDENKMDKVAVLNEDGTEVVKKIDLGFKMIDEEGNVTKGQLIDRDTMGVLYPETTTERIIGFDEKVVDVIVAELDLSTVGMYFLTNEDVDRICAQEYVPPEGGGGTTGNAQPITEDELLDILV